MRTIFLHSIIVLHKIAILQFIRKSTSIFPPTVYFFYRSCCFLLFNQSKFYMFRESRNGSIFYLFVACVQVHILHFGAFLYVYTRKVRFIVLFYLKYYNLYFNTFLFVNILFFLFICQYFLL